MHFVLILMGKIGKLWMRSAAESEDAERNRRDVKPNMCACVRTRGDVKPNMCWYECRVASFG